MSATLKILLVLWMEATFVQHIQCKNTMTAEQNSDELIFAHTICRHGDRNIYEPFPNDPWSSEQFWPGGYAQLTNIGKQQLYEFGQGLRKRYAKLIGDGYSERKVYVQSTDMDRTLMSAQAAMAGLFPPSLSEKWNYDIDWQPIPVHTKSLNHDYLLASGGKCDHYDYIMLEYMNKNIYGEGGLLNKYQPLISYLERGSGQKLPTVTSVFSLYDILFVEKLKGFCLSDWAERAMDPRNDIGRDFKYLALQWYRMFTVTTEMKKLKSGYLLKEILDRFTNKIQLTLSPDRSLWMYFAHDITITNMLNSLGVFELHQPLFGSCLFFELYGRNEPYVRISYKNSTKTNDMPLKIPNCGAECPLHRLYELYDEILPTKSFEEECVLRDNEFLPPAGNSENYAL